MMTVSQFSFLIFLQKPGSPDTTRETPFVPSPDAPFIPSYVVL